LDGFDIPGWFASRFGCPVLVDEDVSAMAFGEHGIVAPAAGRGVPGHTIDGVGHLLHIQRPQPVARAMAEFLTGNSTAG